ncbi:MAG: DegT/DnrJ/EryC1/StrS family aminotransferase [Gammaproteobacteria bacterium]
MKIPYEDLEKVNAPFMAAFKEAAATVIEKGWYILGQEVEKFEQDFARFHGAKYAVGVASGLDALRLALMALELPPQSEVIVSANSYIATVLAVTQAGHIPVLVDPRLEDGNIDPSKIEAAITKKTRAIMPVHCYGQPCDMKGIGRIVEQYGLALIEDCAQAHNATFQGKMVGTFGDVGAFSFYPTKNLGALGDAGAIITNSETLFDKIKSLRNYGEKQKYQNQYLGLNSRLDEIQAAFLNVKLQHLVKITEHKRHLADIYYKILRPEWLVSPKRQDALSVYHIFSIRHSKRDALQKYLLERGIGTAIHYPTPPYRQAAYEGQFVGEYPVSDEWHTTTLSLPISFGHRTEEIEYVAKRINEFES